MEFPEVQDSESRESIEDFSAVHILSPNEVNQVQQKCSDLGEFKSVITIGMGGSIRGSLTITSIFGDKKHYGVNSLEPDLIDSVFEEASKPCIHLSSKSGKTIETVSAFNYISDNHDVSKDNIVVTSAEGSDLSRFAEENNILAFKSPSEISGRFSAFSYYGMVPSHLAGVNIQKACSTAREEFQGGGESAELASRILGISSEEILFIGSYSSKMSDFNSWVEQLWLESLGKNGNGVHVSTGIGPRFQHSTLQRLLDGKENISCILIRMEEGFENQTTTSLSSDNSVSFEHIIESSFIETLERLERNNVPVLPIRVQSNVEDLTRLIVGFEIAVVQRAVERGVSPFKQDSVDGTKSSVKERIDETS